MVYTNVKAVASLLPAFVICSTSGPSIGRRRPSGERLAGLAALYAAEHGELPSGGLEQELHVGQVRDAIMPHGPTCPRCQSKLVVRYGRRGGVQRYKCKACCRTYTDFTSTIFHSLRRRDLWLEFCQCLIEGLTVRETAARLGVSKNTSFAWRHRAMAALAAVDSADTCEGIVEMVRWPVLRNFKGSPVPKHAMITQLKSSIRRHHQVYAHFLPAPRLAIMLVLVDRSGHTRAAVAQRNENLAPHLSSMVSGVSEICASWRIGSPRIRSDWPGRMYWIGQARSVLSTTDPGPLYHVRNAENLARGFQRWLARFQGVATNNLTLYFSWHLRAAALSFTQPTAAARLLLFEILGGRHLPQSG